MGTFAVDVGTSGCRVGAFSDSGLLIHLAERPYEVAHLPGGRTEIAVAVIEKACFEALAEAVQSEAPARIAIGTFMHSLVLLDRDYRPLTPLSVWSDRRALSQCLRLQQRHSEEHWRERTGCILSPAIPFYRVLWYREEQPELFARVAAIASIQSYLMARLTGLLVEERASAVSCGWCNVNNGEPERELTDLMGLDGVRLPAAIAPTEAFTLTLREGAHNLPAAVRIHAAGTDGPLAHLGTAGRDPGVASLSIGTSTAVRKVLRSHGLPEGSPPDCWGVVLGPSFLAGIASNNGGNVARAVAKLVSSAEEELHPTTLARRALAAPFRPKLLFRPYLLEERHLGGARGCHWSRADSDPLRHLDLFRATLEAVAFHGAYLMERLTRVERAQSVCLSGGAAALPFVSDLLAKLLPVPVFLPPTHCPAPLLGALSSAFPADFSEPPSPEGRNRIIASGSLGHLGDAYREKYGRWKKWIGQEKDSVC